MSNLHRTAIAARLTRLHNETPPELLDKDDDEEEEEDGLGALPANLPSSSNQRNTSTRRNPNSTYTPISASSFFQQAVEVDVPESGLIFRVYYTPPKVQGTNGTVMVFHHGAGYSALSFALVAKEVVDQGGGEVGVLAIDARRHGKTRPASEDVSDEDLSIDTLTKDFVNLIVKIFGSDEKPPTLLLVGHSMGGAVITRACPLLLELKDKKFSITGAVVLDVVEGSAIEALPHMHKLLDSRPDGFGSVEEGIGWHISNHTIRNVESARISVPALLIPNPNPNPSKAGGKAWLWRTPLRSTAPYWTSWFQGLSKSFLSARTARLLILAGTDRLDNELMIGQMQGKFQLEVVPDVGHMLHEDKPEWIAEILLRFWRRNEKFDISKIKKVGDP